MSRFFAILPLALSLLFFVSSIVVATDVHYCEENTKYEVKVKQIHISPNPITRGKPATFGISAKTDREISSGKLVIEVSYFGWHVYSETHDLCTQTMCPVKTGDFVLVHSQLLPGYTPPGSYTLKMKLLEAQKELTCIQFSFNIRVRSSKTDM